MKLSAQAGKTKKAVKVIENLVDSLISHLELTYTKPRQTKESRMYLGGPIFHKKAVRKYAAGIKDAADLL